MKAIGTMFALASLVSTYLAGILGALAMMVVGPPLAMGLQMWSGNTEPAHPHLPWPHLATFVALLLPVPLLYRKQWGVASIAAVPVALLPFWQLWRLYVAAGAA